MVTALAHRRVAPFGHPGIIACVPLPPAYRSLPRPSSPPCAQASPTCLRSLDYNMLCQAEHARSFRSFQRVTILVLIVQDEIEKSLNENSQIRDLPPLPLSNSSDARTRRPASLQKKTEFGNWMSRRATSNAFHWHSRGRQLTRNPLRR